jgi:hypothetical protein
MWKILVALTLVVPSAVSAQPIAPVGGEVAEPMHVPDRRPRRLPYDPGDPIPAGYHLEERRSIGFLASGLGVFLGFYLPSAAIGLEVANDDDGSWAGWLAIPILGPPIAAVVRPSRDCSDRFLASLCESGETLGSIMLGLSFVGQTVGAVLLAFGLGTRPVLIRNEEVALSLATASPGADVGGGLDLAF